MNIKTIAQMAGVSISTVSKILNNYSDVSEDTKRKVLKIMEETGYHRMSDAKINAAKQSNLVGVVFAGKLNVDFTHPFFVDVINTFKKQIGLLGYDLLFFSNEKFDDGDINYLARSRHFNLNGCIILAGDEVESSVYELDESEIPCIGIDIKLNGKNSAYIMSDNSKISYKVVEHCYLHGIREIGLLGIERASEVANIRKEAFLESMRSYGLPVKEQWMILSKDYREVDGYQAMKQFLNSKVELPRAIFAVSDLLAFGAMRALKERGIRIPDDISIIGCDDIEACRYTDPPLTTVRQDKQKIGRLAAMMLFDLMNHQAQVNLNRIMVEPDLIVRRSCIL